MDSPRRFHGRTKAHANGLHGGRVMSEKTTWGQFFDARMPIYEERVFTRTTLKELDLFIE